VIRTQHGRSLRAWRSPGFALVIAIAALAPRAVQADDQPSSPPDLPPGDAPPPGAAPVYGPPPTYAPPTYAPPAYGPPGYAPAPYSAPIYAPEEITDFDDSAPVPYGYTRVQRARKGPIIGGAVTLGATYLVTAFAAAVAAEFNHVDGNNTDVSAMLVPVAGPFLQLQNTGSPIGRFGLVVLGSGQVTGAVLLIYGLTSPRTILVRNDQLSLGPMVGRGVSGLTLSGKF
jgi:hypothetical protein